MNLKGYKRYYLMAAALPGTSKKGIKLKTKATLVVVMIVSVFAVYSYFAYPRDFFPFTKENKDKLNSIFKGKKKQEDEETRKSIEDLLAQQEAELAGSVETPRGGTGAKDLADSLGLGEPSIKGDETIMNQYLQEMYRQLYLPYEDEDGGGRSPGNLEGDTEPFQPTVRGGDIPPGYLIGTDVAPDIFPYPSEDFSDIYPGFYPPGGTYRPHLGDYDPYYWQHSSYPYGGDGICADCGPGRVWDSCGCKCVDEDAPRLMCFRPECACGTDDIMIDEDEYEGDTDEQNAALARIRAQKASKLKVYSAIRTRRALEARDAISPNEQQYAFSKLQDKAIKMQNLNEPPTSHLRYKQLLTTLPPIVGKRQMAARLAIS